MLPGSRGVYRWTMSMVTFPARKGDDHAAADPAGDTGPGRPGRAGTPLPHHPRRRDPYPLPDGAAVRPGPHPTPDRAAGAMQPRYRAPGAQALPGRWARRRAAPAAPGAATPLPAWVGAGTGPGRRLGSPRGWGRQCAVDLPAFGRLPSRGDRPPGGDRDGQDRVAAGRVCLQAAPLGADPQGPGPAGVGKKRVRVEALLAAAAAPVPPPACDLVPDATLADDLYPEDLPRLLGLRAELGADLVLVYTPTYDPEANRIEWLWRSLRRTVTHTHQRRTLADLVADADAWAHTITPAQVLGQIGSPFAPNQLPPVREELDHAA